MPRFDRQPPMVRRGGLVRRGQPSIVDRAVQRAAARDALLARFADPVPEQPPRRVVPLQAQLDRAAAGLRNAGEGIGAAVHDLRNRLAWATSATTAVTSYQITGGTVTYQLNAGTLYTGNVHYQPQTWTTIPMGNQPMATYNFDPEPIQRTPEQIEADERERERARLAYIESQRLQTERQAASMLARAAANERARNLMRFILTDEQWVEFERDNAVTVRGSAGGRYRVVCRGHDHNVFYLNEAGEQVSDLCAHPDSYDENGGRLPETDLHAGQVLALQTDEQGWLARANGRRPPHYVPPERATPLVNRPF